MDWTNSIRFFGLTDDQFLDEVINSPVTTTPPTEPVPTGTDEVSDEDMDQQVELSAEDQAYINKQAEHDRKNTEAYQALLDAEITDACLPRPTGRPRAPDWAESRIKQQIDRVQKEKVISVRTARLKNVRILDRIVDRLQFIAPSQGGRQRGAISRSAVKSGDSNSDDGGDPDPADVLILDPWSSINTHKESKPINRVVRKAILAHRNGVDKKHPVAYTWYVNAALAEFRRALKSAVSKQGALTPSVLDDCHDAANRMFFSLVETHDFNATPNALASTIINGNRLWTPKGLRSYARNGLFAEEKSNRTREAYEGKVFEEVMEAHEQADFGFWNPFASTIEPSGDFYQGVKIKHLEPGLTVDKVKDTKDTEDKDTQEKDTKAKAKTPKAPKSPKEKDTPHTYSVKPISAKSVRYPVVASALEKDGSEEDFYIEEDLYEPDFQPEVLPEKDVVAVKKAGDMARQTIQYILNQPDRPQALIDAAMALSELGDDRVLDALSRDKANAGLVAEILALVGYQPAQSKLSEKERKRQLKIQVEDLLENLGRRQTPEYILSNRTDILSFLKDYTDSKRISNVKSNLETIAKNLQGRFSPEIQRAASILFNGGVA